MADNDRKDAGELEGEGSYSATKQYEESQKKFSKTHDAEELAEDAARDVEDNKEEYAKAEEAGKSRAKT